MVKWASVLRRLAHTDLTAAVIAVQHLAPWGRYQGLLTIKKEHVMAVIGDLYEIDLEKDNGKGYFQYCYKTQRMGYLIKVFRKIHNTRPDNISEIVEGKDFFWLYFPVESARRQGVIKRLGKYNIPASANIPPYMRTTSFTISDDMVCGVLRKGDEKVSFKNMPIDDFFALSKEMLCNLIVVRDMLLKGWHPSKSRF